jgi:hypothetical protein
MKTILTLLATALLLASTASTLAGVHYVDVNSTNATPPYTNWTTAATKIQDAVDAAVAGDEIVVTDGMYQPIGVDKPLSVRSVNGPQPTTIDGGRLVRCAYLTNSASLSGFTLINGYVDVASGPAGAGVFCASPTVLVSNCVLSGNQAYLYITRVGKFPGGAGGGAYGGTLDNCTLTDNLAGEGGGAAGCTLNNCKLSNNQAAVYDNYTGGLLFAYGGGAYGSTLNNCTLVGNSAWADMSKSFRWDSAYVYGGGAYGCTLNNCTLTCNRTSVDYTGGGGGQAFGGGAYFSTLNNCILFNNTQQGICEDCNSPGWLSGDNWIGNPLFVEANGWINLRLQSNSPCINAGNNSYVTNATDLDGNPRISGGTVDIGAYEFQSPVSMISYAWLQQFNLPINSSTDTADPDGDGMSNWQEWICGTDPTNALSALRLLSPTPGVSGVQVTWQSVNTRTYFLERSSNLGAQPAFLPLATNIPGQTGTTTYTDTNAIGTGPWFYRVGVSTP